MLDLKQNFKERGGDGDAKEKRFRSNKNQSPRQTTVYYHAMCYRMGGHLRRTKTNLFIKENVCCTN